MLVLPSVGIEAFQIQTSPRPTNAYYNYYRSTKKPSSLSVSTFPQQHYLEEISSSFTSTTLIPISYQPLMLKSSNPLLSIDECNKLIQYFDYVGGNYDHQQNGVHAIKIDNGKRILEKVWKQIDELTGLSHHDGENKLPRFVRYNNKEETLQLVEHPTLTPDGLHVDTNNGHLFRHVTVLLYLTTNSNSGATTFPIAHPIMSSHHGNNNEGQQQEEEEAAASAIRLLTSNIHHTQQASQTKQNQIDSKLLENKALQLFNDNNDSTSTGIRVLPSAGHIVVFCNYDDNGMIDPYSFHGGEDLFFKQEEESQKEEKILLTFFKEVPRITFTTREEFTLQVQQTNQYIFERYC